VLTRNIIKPNSYHDSVFLMAIAGRVSRLSGIAEVSCLMGTDENRKVVSQSGLLTQEGEQAGPNDLLIAVQAEGEEALARALAEIEAALAQKRTGDDWDDDFRPRSLAGAKRLSPEANLALISLPGRYVRREAERALDLGMHVFVFSDNVSVDDEVALKKKAQTLGLLVMGPDCGTAILNGAALGFANVVRRGNIGIVAAAGTGLQEVSAQVHRYGGGISQAIGTGGRDLKEDVGGLTMLQGLRLLDRDPATSVIVLVSKPPSAVVAEAILRALEHCKKPAVVNFLGENWADDPPRYLCVQTMEAAARTAVAMAMAVKGGPLEEPEARPEGMAHPGAGRRYLRGLFSGGTLAYEAILVLEKRLGPVWSNIALSPESRLPDSRVSRGHTVVDLGEDEFTVGRPHPMIDFTLRNQRIVQEADDPTTAVILLDVVLGFGAHDDPAAALAPAISHAIERGVAVVAYILGTDEDPQNLAAQKEKLEGLGAVVLPSNIRAVEYAAAITGGDA
jgi:FdrA protein